MIVSGCDREFNINLTGALCMILLLGAPIAHLGERQTLDRKVAGSIHTGGGVLCP